MLLELYPINTAINKRKIVIINVVTLITKRDEVKFMREREREICDLCCCLVLGWDEI